MQTISSNAETVAEASAAAAYSASVLWCLKHQGPSASPVQQTVHHCIDPLGTEMTACVRCVTNPCQKWVRRCEGTMCRTCWWVCDCNGKSRRSEMTWHMTVPGERRGHICCGHKKLPISIIRCDIHRCQHAVRDAPPALSLCAHGGESASGFPCQLSNTGPVGPVLC